MLGIDDALAEVVTSSTQPTLGAIRLAWWREALERLDHQGPPPEPRLQDAAAQLLTRGITGRELAGLEEGWAAMLEEAPDLKLAGERGARLFRLGARLLGVEYGDETLGAAGRLYAGVGLGRRGLLDIDRESIGAVGSKIERRARPLTALAVLAARDLRRGGPPFEPEATPGRAAALLAHRLFGRGI